MSKVRYTQHPQSLLLVTVKHSRSDWLLVFDGSRSGSLPKTFSWCLCGCAISDLQVSVRFSNLPHNSLQRLTNVKANTLGTFTEFRKIGYAHIMSIINLNCWSRKYCKLDWKIKKTVTWRAVSFCYRPIKLHKPFGAIRLAPQLNANNATEQTVCKNILSKCFNIFLCK